MPKSAFYFVCLVLSLGLVLPTWSQLQPPGSILQDMKKDLQTLKQEVRDLRLNLQTSQISLTEALKKSENLQTELEIALTTSENLGKDSIELTRQLKDLKQELQVLKNYISSLETENTALKIGGGVLIIAVIVEGILLATNRR